MEVNNHVKEVSAYGFFKEPEPVTMKLIPTCAKPRRIEALATMQFAIRHQIPTIRSEHFICVECKQRCMFQGKDNDYEYC